LAAEVCELRRRVSHLESAALIASPHAPAALPAAALPEVHVSSDLVPSIGHVLLALAGGYVLRALTDLGVWPRAAGVLAGLVYALAWLWIARRTGRERKLRAAAHFTICALIVAPLVWEGAARLHVFGSWSAALVLVAFAAAAFDAIVAAACAITALVLLITTHDLLPCTLAVLAIALVEEIAAIAGRAKPARWLIAALADAAVLSFTFLMHSDGTLPEGYAPVPPFALAAMQIALLAIYAGSIAVGRVSAAAITQAGVAWAIGLGGLWFAGHLPAAGGIAWAAAAACYAVALGTRRDPRVYAIFALVLTICGGLALMPPLWAAGLWCAIAIATSAVRVVAWQGPLYLWIAAGVSGAAAGVYAQLFGEGKAALLPLIAVLITGGVIYAFAANAPARLLAAAAIAWPAAGLAIRGVPLTSAGTIALVAVAVIAAWVARRWTRRELAWLAYALMFAGGVRLLLRDLGGDNTALVFALVPYGGALIFLPRLLRRTE
jgi:hypothetical protein